MLISPALDIHSERFASESAWVSSIQPSSTFASTYPTIPTFPLINPLDHLKSLNGLSVQLHSQPRLLRQVYIPFLIDS